MSMATYTWPPYIMRHIHEGEVLSGQQRGRIIALPYAFEDDAWQLVMCPCCTTVPCTRAQDWSERDVDTEAATERIDLHRCHHKRQWLREYDPRTQPRLAAIMAKYDAKIAAMRKKRKASAAAEEE